MSKNIAFIVGWAAATLLLVAFGLLAIPYIIMIILNSFGVDITFWQTVGAWWLTSLLMNLFSRGFSRGK